LENNFLRRFYAPPENFNQAKITLSPEETRHLRDVLRLREGEKVIVFDGVGREFLGQIETIGKKETSVQIIEEVTPLAPESALELILAVALLKGEKFELVIQKAVELGVTKFVPIVTKRCEIKLKDADKKLERWRKIVLEASKQCGRAKLMTVENPIDFELLMKVSVSKALDDENFVLFSEKSGQSFSSLKSSRKLTAVIGSEGGWEASEIETAKQNNFQIITLGGRILRAETAAIAIPALLQNHFGDLK